MTHKTPITPADASRIQSDVDRNDGDAGFKARAAAAAAKNTAPAKSDSPTKSDKR